MMKNLLFFVLALSISSTVNAAGSFSTIEERMSGSEFEKTGLVKLNADELAALNEWLRSHSVATLENASAHPSSGASNARTSKDMRGFDNQSESELNGKDPDLIHARIVGTINGWDTKGSLFQLDNGMVWQQSEKDTFYLRQPVKNPEVTIEKGMMGIWRLTLVGHDDRVRVKRIE